LPEYLVEQADEEMLKSSYDLEFLGIRREIKERELKDLSESDRPREKLQAKARAFATPGSDDV
jgi:hypothetical protein